MNIELPHGFRIERGLMWPDYDRECAAVVFDWASDIDIVLQHVEHRDCVVQAGGNCGVWARILAGKFGKVITFEPDPKNFSCLGFNTAGLPNVARIQAALGAEKGFISMEEPVEHNCGALRVVSGGVIPQITLDSFKLDALDLLMLDIEGPEMLALQGAYDHIARFMPVIVVEDKGLSKHYGFEKGDIEKWLKKEFNYKVVARPHRDVVLVA